MERGRLTLDPFVAVLPGSDDRLRLSSPHTFAEVEASSYQVQLLMAFQDGAHLGEVLERYPFEKSDSVAFLESCRRVGLLRPSGAAGGIAPPDRVPASPRWAGTPPFEAERPSAFAFLGVPFDGNTTGTPGARFGPASVRAASEGLRYLLDPRTRAPLGFHDFSSGRGLLAGITLADAGDVYVSPGEDGPELYARVTDAVRDLVEVGALPILVGGDHSLTAAALAAFPAEPMQVLHLDAHTDLGELERADETGLHHGNVFTVVLRDFPHVQRIVQIGLRGVIEASSAIDHEKVHQVGMDQLRGEGVGAALSALAVGIPTYLSIDIDVVDPAFAPSTGTPVAGGLFPHELKEIVRAAGRGWPLIGLDVMEVAQPLGLADGTAGIALEAVLTAADATLERMVEGLRTEHE